MDKFPHGGHSACEASETSEGAPAVVGRQRGCRRPLAACLWIGAQVGLALSAVKANLKRVVQVLVRARISGTQAAGPADASTSHTVAKLGAEREKSASDAAPQLRQRARAGVHGLLRRETAQKVATANNVDAGVVHVLKLARLLGLRLSEAILCGPSLETWLRLVAEDKRYLPVERGTMYGRPRFTEVLTVHEIELFVTLDDALQFCCRCNFQLITGCDGDLQTALRLVETQSGRIHEAFGLRVNSARDAYMVDFAYEMLDKGVPPEDVVAILTRCLDCAPSHAEYLVTHCGVSEHVSREDV